jgi:hypothetical protein
LYILTLRSEDVKRYAGAPDAFVALPERQN